MPGRSVKIRARGRERAALRRAAGDEQFVADLAAAVWSQFPGCPEDRAMSIARHARERGSGRVGRTQAGRSLDSHAVRLAVTAAVRHGDTEYEDLLMRGVPREDARALVRADIDRVLESWQ